MFALLCACGDSDRDHDTLIIGTSGDNPPFEFYQNGELVGFDIDLGRMLAEKLGRKVSFVDMPFESLVAALQSKKVDLVLAAMTATDDRKRAVDFTRPYYKASAVLVTPGLTNLDTIKDLNNTTIAVQLGSTFELYAKETLIPHAKITLRSLNKVTDMIQELRLQRIEGLIIGTAEAARILNANSSFRVMPLPDSKSAGEAVVLPKGSSLTQTLDTMIATLEAEGVLERQKEKWGMD